MARLIDGETYGELYGRDTVRGSGVHDATLSELRELPVGFREVNTKDPKLRRPLKPTRPTIRFGNGPKQNS